MKMILRKAQVFTAIALICILKSVSGIPRTHVRIHIPVHVHTIHHTYKGKYAPGYDYYAGNTGEAALLKALSSYGGLSDSHLNALAHLSSGQASTGGSSTGAYGLTSYAPSWQNIYNSAQGVLDNYQVPRGLKKLVYKHGNTLYVCRPGRKANSLECDVGRRPLYIIRAGKTILYVRGHPKKVVHLFPVPPGQEQRRPQRFRPRRPQRRPLRYPLRFRGRLPRRKRRRPAMFVRIRKYRL